MINPTQILIIVVVIVLTVVLSLIGIQVYFVLKEVQKSIQKTNKILDDAGVISESVAQPVASLSTAITGASGLAGLFGWLRRTKTSREEKNERS